jgi:hypothetical protein
MSYVVRGKLGDVVDSSEMLESMSDLGVFDLISRHTHMEKLCEQALTEQDALARSYYSRDPSVSRPSDDLVEVKSGEMEPRNSMSISDIAYDNYRELKRLAQTVVPPGLPNASKRFVINACTPEFVDLELLEESIKIFRFRMSSIEQEILDHVARSAREAVAKLKFMSGLLLDGGEIEIDYFAYLVEECADIIDDGLSDGQTSIKPDGLTR